MLGGLGEIRVVVAFKKRHRLSFEKLIRLKHFSLSLRHLHFVSAGSIFVKNALQLPLPLVGSIEQRRLNTSAKCFNRFDVADNRLNEVLQSSSGIAHDRACFGSSRLPGMATEAISANSATNALTK